MTEHYYECQSCESLILLDLSPVEINAKGYVDRSKGYTQTIVVSALSEQEEKDLPMHLDPRDFIKTETIFWSEVPSNLICECGGEAVVTLPTNLSGRCSGRAMTYGESRKFVEDGYNKQQAEQFYKDSIRDSKERMKEGGVHYKRVEPDMNFMVKNGLAKPCKNPSKKAADLKRINQEIIKPLNNLKKK